MAEDFTTYTEVDPAADLTVTAAKIDAVTCLMEQDTYVYYDYGANYFNGFDDDFEIYCASTSQDSGTGGMGIANQINDSNGWTAPYLKAYIQPAAPTANVRFYNGTNLDTYGGSFNTIYYCTLSRAAANGTGTLKVYSDAARTNLLATLSITGCGTGAWQYSYGFTNTNNGATNRAWTGYVQNMTITLAGGAIINIAGVVAGIATVSGAIKRTRSVSGLATGIATVSGAIKQTRNVASLVTGIATVTAAAIVNRTRVGIGKFHEQVDMTGDGTWRLSEIRKRMLDNIPITPFRRH